ncbi:hypothetical protein GIB67_030426 [Kingdonia uniflora]|uniref:ACB domain-containing protein n=1 Tax=Kingdonia uniflora TaxID=39325 RepID=A0A7J7NDV6_9MAGN|nr:hypothetical protein GIB67_030426 [Kingdonia uniflora]
MNFYLELFFTTVLSLALAYLFGKLVSMALADSLTPSNVEEQMSEFESDRGVIVENDVFVTPELEIKRGVVQFEGEVVYDGGEDCGVEVEEEHVEVVEYVDDQELGIGVEMSNLETQVGLEEIGVEMSNEESDEVGVERIEEEDKNGKFEFGSEGENNTGLEKEVLVGDDEDWGWEGIERSEVEVLFSAAAKFVGDSDSLLKLGSDVQMQLSGLHKVSMEGPCREPPPMALMVSARAKWNSWQRLGNMNPEAAMEQYISLLSDIVPGWMEGNPEGHRKNNKSNDTVEAGESGTKAHNSSSYPLHQPCFENESKKAIEVEPLGESGDVIGGQETV